MLPDDAFSFLPGERSALARFFFVIPIKLQKDLHHQGWFIDP